MFVRMNFFLFLILISTALPIDSSYSQDFQKQTASGPQKKILVLTTSGGGGHSAAAQAVRESLEDRYEVNVLDIIGHLPLLEGGAKIFDHCFANQSWSYMKILLFLQPKAVEDLAVLYCKKKIISLITEKSPDLIVSVLPTANYVYLEEAKQLGIPLVVIPTDFTPTAFFHKIKNLRASQTLTIILPFEEPKTSSYLRMRDLNNLVYDGYPVRRIFNDIGNKLKSGDSNLKEDLKNYALTRFQIDTARGDKAVFLGMGAKGFAGKLIQRYAEIFLAYGHMALSSQEAHLHVLIASGSNKGLLDKLTELRNRHLRTGNSSRIHLHPLEWMNGDQMAQTLAISDVVMTKPGGSTVAEAISLGRFMLLLPDSTTALRWEKANLSMVVANHWGEALNRLEPGNKNVVEVMAQINSALAGAPSGFPKNYFHEKFSETIDGLLGPVVLY